MPCPEVAPSAAGRVRTQSVPTGCPSPGHLVLGPWLAQLYTLELDVGPRHAHSTSRTWPPTVLSAATRVSTQHPQRGALLSQTAFVLPSSGGWESDCLSHLLDLRTEAGPIDSKGSPAREPWHGNYPAGRSASSQCFLLGKKAHTSGAYLQCPRVLTAPQTRPRGSWGGCAQARRQHLGGRALSYL